MATYCCSECGGNHVTEVKTNYSDYYVTMSNQLQVDTEFDEDTPETKTHWECRDCGLILPCETFGEVQAYIEGRL